MVEQVGSYILTVLLLIFIVAGSILIAREIDWKTLVNGFRESGNKGKIEKEKRKTRSQPSTELRVPFT